MSKGDSKSGRSKRARGKSEADVVPSGLQFEAARETELWNRVGRRGQAVQTLIQAKMNLLGGYLQTLDSAPLTASELSGFTGQALRRAIEKPGVDEALGAGLPAEAHKLLCRCTAEALEKTNEQASLSARDSAEWVKTRILRDPFEEALKMPCDGEDALWQAIHDGREAVEILLLHYTRLALHLARARRGRGMPLQDLESAAMEGLRKAVDKFDTTKDNKFSTFATTVINNEIRTAFRNAPATGSHHTRQAAKFELQRQLLANALGRPPSDGEIYQALGWSELESENFARGKLLLITKSLDAKSRTSRESIIEQREGGLLDQMIAREDNDRLYEALRRLDGRSQHVLLRRFIDESLSQRAVGEELGLTRDQIRTIEENALKAMKRDLGQAEQTPSHAEQ